MSHGVERCPRDGGPLTARTNGLGLAYLECPCGYVEPVLRRVDPKKGVWSVKVDEETGWTRNVYRVDKSYRDHGRRGGMLSAASKQAAKKARERAIRLRTSRRTDAKRAFWGEL